MVKKTKPYSLAEFVMDMGHPHPVPLKTIEPVTMSSREIESVTGKRHRDIKRDIENMLTELVKDARSFARIYLDSMSREQTEYVLDQELTFTLLAGYSVQMRHAIVKRWLELESNARDRSLLDHHDYGRMERLAMGSAHSEIAQFILKRLKEYAKDEKKHAKEALRVGVTPRAFAVGDLEFVIKNALTMMVYEEKRAKLRPGMVLSQLPNWK